MKKSELKKILKPLVTECIKEVIFEEGILSGIITEVARGMSVETSAAAPKTDPVTERMQRNAFDSERSTALREQKRKLMSAIGSEAYNGVNLFEGTTPGTGPSTASQQASPMAHQPAGDPGVDISNLVGSAKTNWNAHMGDLNEGK